MNSRFIIKSDHSLASIPLGRGKVFDFAELQKEKGRSWHSRPYEYSFVVRKMKRAFESNFIRLDKVLDLACGTNHPGYMAIAAIERVGQIIALDNDKALLYNGMNHPKVYKLIGDATNTKFNNETFDAISCVSALEHMSNWRDCIKEMYRLLRPGAMAFVTIDISTDVEKTEKHWVDDKSPDWYADEFERVGFKFAGSYNNDLPEDAVDTICSKYPLAASESELLDGQHNALKTFRMVLRKRI